MEQEMNITQAQYQLNMIGTQNVTIRIVVNGVEMSVPLAEGNRHYDEIMRQVDAGTLTITQPEEAV